LDTNPTDQQLSAPENAGRYILVQTFANISEPFSEINNGKVTPFEPSEFDNYAKI
jgi:hypothetical protein